MLEQTLAVIVKYGSSCTKLLTPLIYDLILRIARKHCTATYLHVHPCYAHGGAGVYAHVGTL